MEGLGARAIQRCMFMRVLRERTKANLLGYEVLGLLEICECAKADWRCFSNWLDLHDNSAIAVRLCDSFELVHSFEGGLVYFEHLSHDSFPLAWCIDEPRRMAITYKVEWIALFCDEGSRPANSLVGREVWETLLKGAEDEYEVNHFPRA